MSNITEPTWPENQKPTPQDFRVWYALQAEAGQLEIAEKVLRWADEAQTCFEQNHEAAVEQLHRANQRIAELLEAGA